MSNYIDPETTAKILDTADIVDVVSDYVKLRRSGANYMGLCPFHNERTPSFSVSKAKNICKCFSCGKGGSPVNFIMEIEQLSYGQALRFLAKKYNIPIPEREQTDEERRAQSERESMLAVNEFARDYFSTTLTSTPEGQNIGMAYFRQRGISELMVKKFGLGYSMEAYDGLLKAARAKGFSDRFLVETGLVIKNDQGKMYDRFRGRVIYPIYSLSGRVLAFGGRTLRSDKTMAKYVNSPESSIYSKRAELYGLYQARQAINRKKKCILVEGYMDVISMHQAGVENVVASSGTSLTERQIHLIHRFADDVTVIYDSDPAGIKASLRGIDLLLAQGLNIKVVLLPDGDDPDSFAQTHSSTEVEEYITANEVDFIAFKTRILLADAQNDPIARSRVINDVVGSLALIPDDITRTVYVTDTARRLGISEDVVRLEVQRRRQESLNKARTQTVRDQAGATVAAQQQQDAAPAATAPDSDPARLRPFELELLRYAVRYGMTKSCDAVDADGNITGEISVVSYIAGDLETDGVEWSNPDIAATFAAALALDNPTYHSTLASFRESLEQTLRDMRSQGHAQIAAEAGDSTAIQKAEKALEERIEAEREARTADFIAGYSGQRLANHPDDTIRRLATELLAEPHSLSKIHTKFVHVASERERCPELVDRALFGLKDAIIDCRLLHLRDQLKTIAPNDTATMLSLMEQIAEQMALKHEFAPWIGDRVLSANLKVKR